MKRVKIINRLITMACVIFEVLVCAQNVQASTDLIKKGNEWLSKGGSGSLSMTTVWANLEPVAQVMLAIAVVTVVGVGMVIGVRFMLQGPDEKARMKERLIWYIIAMVLIFGVVGIFNIIVGVLGGIVGSGTSGTGSGGTSAISGRGPIT